MENIRTNESGESLLRGMSHDSSSSSSTAGDRCSLDDNVTNSARCTFDSKETAKMENRCSCQCGGYVKMDEDISDSCSCKYNENANINKDSFEDFDRTKCVMLGGSDGYSYENDEYSRLGHAARHESGVGLLRKRSNSSAESTRPINMVILQTVSMYLAYFSLGSFNVLLGPTLLNLEVLFETDLKTMTLTFTGTGLGYLLGVILCGIIFDRLNKEALLAVCVLLVSLFHGMAPWFGSIFVYIVCIGIASVGLGIIDAGGQSYCMNLWQGHRYKKAIFHGLHLMAALGNVLCPLIIGPFLVELNVPTNQNSSLEIRNTTNSLSIIFEEEAAYGDALQKFILPNSTDNVYTEIVQFLHVNTTSNTTHAIPLDVSGVKYAYLMMAFVTLPGAFLFGFSWCCTKSQSNRENLEDNIEIRSDREGNIMENGYNTTRTFRVVLLSLLFTYFFLYLLLSAIPVALLSAFVVKGLNWSMRNGVLITSVLTFGFTGVRIISIFISVFVSPSTMIYTNCALMIAVQIVMLFAQQLPDYAIWTCACAMGVAMATAYASVMLWMSEHMAVTGKAASVCVFGMSVAFVVGPSTIGYLFQTYSPMYFIYTVFLASILQLVCFLSMVLYTKCNKPTLVKANFYVDNIQTRTDILQKGVVLEK